MTFDLRQSILLDGQPGMVCGKTYSTNQYDVLLASGVVKTNVDEDRLRPRPVEIRGVA